MSKCLSVGHKIVVPAIVYYELNRELIRAGKTAGVRRLQAFCSASPGRYLPLSDEALRLAAELWAIARRQGRPTAGLKNIDVDVILAAQALSCENDVDVVTAVVVTANVKHLARFVQAKDWREIVL